MPAKVLELFARRGLAEYIAAVAEEEPGVEAARGVGRRDRSAGLRALACPGETSFMTIGRARSQRSRAPALRAIPANCSVRGSRPRRRRFGSPLPRERW